jgi:hypothetical protein
VGRARNFGRDHPPLIAYNIGALGRTSQVFNSILTAVTHPAITQLEERADGIARGYLRVVLILCGLSDRWMCYCSEDFYIYGENVAYSLSPAMHNAAHQHCGMGHTYSIPAA